MFRSNDLAQCRVVFCVVSWFLLVQAALLHKATALPSVSAPAARRNARSSAIYPTNSQPPSMISPSGDRVRSGMHRQRVGAESPGGRAAMQMRDTPCCSSRKTASVVSIAAQTIARSYRVGLAPLPHLGQDGR